MLKNKIILIIFLLFCVEANAQWRNLFDGKTFNGWTKYLGVPHQSNQGIDLPKDENGKYARAFGINNDPLNVYRIVNEDGQPAIRLCVDAAGEQAYAIVGARSVWRRSSWFRLDPAGTARRGRIWYVVLLKCAHGR